MNNQLSSRNKIAGAIEKISPTGLVTGWIYIPPSLKDNIKLELTFFLNDIKVGSCVIDDNKVDNAHFNPPPHAHAFHYQLDNFSLYMEKNKSVLNVRLKNQDVELWGSGMLISSDSPFVGKITYCGDGEIRGWVFDHTGKIDRVYIVAYDGDDIVGIAWTHSGNPSIVVDGGSIGDYSFIMYINSLHEIKNGRAIRVFVANLNHELEGSPCFISKSLLANSTKDRFRFIID